MAVIEPFPGPGFAYKLPLETADKLFNECADKVAKDPSVSSMAGAVVDVTGKPALPPYFGFNDTEMIYVGSLAKIYVMYAAFELRWRVEVHAKTMIANGLSTGVTGWERKVFAELRKAWQPKLNSAFPGLRKDFPKLADIFVLSGAGDVGFAAKPLTETEINNIDGSGVPKGKFLDWMKLMIRWSNNLAAGKCIRALSYPYINGALASAGFFDRPSKSGLWISGDYAGNDWLPNNRARQRLSPRWARLQRRRDSNFTGTALQVARLMTLLAQGRLVDPVSSNTMLSMMADGIAGTDAGNFVRLSLESATPPRGLSWIKSKIGIGNDGFRHDCAVVHVDVNPTKALRYVSVVLGSPNSLPRFRKLAVGFHDCIVARSP